MGHFARDCPNQDPQPTRVLGRLHHTLEAETPISISLLNEFFNKLMQSERKQEITEAKLKKARQQLSTQANPSQVQVEGHCCNPFCTSCTYPNCFYCTLVDLNFLTHMCHFVHSHIQVFSNRQHTFKTTSK